VKLPGVSMISTHNFFFQKDKQQLLVDFLLHGNVIDEKYHLILVSCYFNLESTNTIIQVLQKKISLYKISIYIDRGEAICIELDKINDWIKNKHSNNIEISFSDKVDKKIDAIKEDIKNINDEKPGDQVLEIFNKYNLDINTNILNYCLYLSIECQNLIFLNWLDTDRFIKIQEEIDKKNKAKKDREKATKKN
jgi:hypothetical protein